MMRTNQTMLFVTLIVLLVFSGATTHETHNDKSLQALRRIDCVVKRLNRMINVTEHVLLKSRKHVEEVYKKMYFLEERCTIWKEFSSYSKQFMKKERVSEIKKILNEMEDISETESFVKKEFDFSVAYLEKKVMGIVRTGIRYAATMEEMYRVGLEAVCFVNTTLNYCGDNSAHVTCDGAFFGKDLSDVITVFDSSPQEYINVTGMVGPLSKKVHSVSTTGHHVIRNKGIVNNLKGHVETNDYGWLEIVNTTKLLKLFVTHLREVDSLASEIKAMPSKLSGRASRVDALSGQLQSLFGVITVSTTQE